MAPLLEATAHRLIESDDTTATYHGSFDEEWCIGVVPNGGVSLGSVNACIQDYLVNRLHSSHADLFHASSTYLNATDGKRSWVVDIHITKRGKSFTNIDANLSQMSAKNNEMMIRLQTRFIYTNFAKSQGDPSTAYIGLQSGSPFCPTFPCLSEPDENQKSQYEGSTKVNLRHRLALYRDYKAQEAFKTRGELHCAGYMKFLKEQVSDSKVAQFNNVAVLVFADMTENSQEYLPKDRRRESDFWFPTIFLSIEMKRALPQFPLLAVANLVRTRHVDHGQFEMDVELWSHPDDAEKLRLPEGTKSVILCIARQVALTIPLSVQAGIFTKKEDKARM
ncbi:hypothetical protein CBS101457_000957 [Exobasidium rhododendri]|nr:hypothetical protein CBS101457_000957 [Exobasidium rhododendri]